jgi:hypothetical protein
MRPSRPRGDADAVPGLSRPGTAQWNGIANRAHSPRKAFTAAENERRRPTSNTHSPGTVSSGPLSLERQFGGSSTPPRRPGVRRTARRRLRARLADAHRAGSSVSPKTASRSPPSAAWESSAFDLAAVGHNRMWGFGTVGVSAASPGRIEARVAHHCEHPLELFDELAAVRRQHRAVQQQRCAMSSVAAMIGASKRRSIAWARSSRR